MITVIGETPFLVTDSKVLNVDEIIYVERNKGWSDFPKLRITMLTGDKLVFRGPEASKMREDFTTYRSS